MKSPRSQLVALTASLVVLGTALVQNQALARDRDRDGRDDRYEDDRGTRHDPPRDLRDLPPGVVIVPGGRGLRGPRDLPPPPRLGYPPIVGPVIVGPDPRFGGHHGRPIFVPVPRRPMPSIYVEVGGGWRYRPAVVFPRWSYERRIGINYFPTYVVVGNFGLFHHIDEMCARGEAVKLGDTQLMEQQEDFDVIPVDRCGISELKFFVTHNRAHIHSVVVRFFDSEYPQTIDLGHMYEMNSTSPGWVDLRGGQRCISEISIVGRTETEDSYRSGIQAKVSVYGRARAEIVPPTTYPDPYPYPYPYPLPREFDEDGFRR